ncbi:hypothetical protein A3744_15735, partial [Oleiphilus sp. HI0073]
ELQVYQIVTLNHAWKRQRELRGAAHPTVKALQRRKSSLQVSLLRDQYLHAYLRLDQDNMEGEPLYSVRLRSPVKINNYPFRSDAEHIPVRIAEELLTLEELKTMVKKL